MKKANQPMTRLEFDNMSPPEELKPVTLPSPAQVPVDAALASNEVTLQERIEAAAEINHFGLFTVVQADGSEHHYWRSPARSEGGRGERIWKLLIDGQKSKPVSMDDMVEAVTKARREHRQVSGLMAVQLKVRE